MASLPTYNQSSESGLEETESSTGGEMSGLSKKRKKHAFSYRIKPFHGSLTLRKDLLKPSVIPGSII